MELENILLTQHFAPKSVKFQNNGTNDLPPATWAPPGSTIFLSEILVWISSMVLISSMSYLSMAKKVTSVFDGKNSIFQNNKVENFKNLEILRLNRVFFNFLQALNFDTFMLANWNFLHTFYAGNSTGK